MIRLQLRDALLDRTTLVPIAQKGDLGTLERVDRGLYVTYVIKLDSGRTVRVEPMDVRQLGVEEPEHV